MAERILMDPRNPNRVYLRRSRYGVGKDMRGLIYLHRNYEHLLPNQPQLKHAKKVLKRNHPDFEYNVVKLDPKTNRTTFFNSAEFDTVPEPVAGEYVVVDGGRSAKSRTNNIWHHKWLWVDDDYKGFDIEDNYQRSRQIAMIPNLNTNRMGNKRIWETEYLPNLPPRSR